MNFTIFGNQCAEPGSFLFLANYGDSDTWLSPVNSVLRLLLDSTADLSKMVTQLCNERIPRRIAILLNQFSSW